MQNKFNMAPSNALTVEEIINGFPNPVLPKIDNEPIFEDIQITTRLLNANAISITSMAGGGAHGHLGIIMSQVEYAAVSASLWVEPFNPNTIPIIPPGTNAVDAAQLARMRAECRQIYTNRINVDQALKNSSSRHMTICTHPNLKIISFNMQTAQPLRSSCI
jgi:hypothetical protein